MTISEKSTICIILDPAHGKSTPGKRSPDGSFYEWKWSREICTALRKRLQDDGYRVVFSVEGEEEIGLANRAQVCNNYCRYFGAKHCVFVSIHANAAGSQGKWMKANGFEVHVAPNASDNSKKLSSLLYKQAENEGLKVRRPLPKQDFWESNFTVLTRTLCPACLIESMFQDNKGDVEFMLSKEGKETFLRMYYNAITEYVHGLLVK